MISLGIEGVIAYSSAKKKIIEAKKIWHGLIYEDDGVSANDFLRMYDMRIYDFNNKSDDIKIFKQWDCEGVYVIHNCSKDIYHVGRSSKVLRKINRNFRGYENQDVYNDWNNNDEFRVRIVRFDDSGYTDINLLEKDLIDKYGTY